MVPELADAAYRSEDNFAGCVHLVPHDRFSANAGRRLGPGMFSTVRQWEIGDKQPSGPSLKLLSLLDRKGLEVLI